MEEDTVVALPRPGSGVTADPLLAVLREGARRMLMPAIEAEIEAFLAAHAGLVDERARPATAGAQRPRARAADPDRGRPSRDPPAQGARPRRGGCRADPVHLGRPADDRRRRSSCAGPGTSKSCCRGCTSSSATTRSPRS
jgi:hypothetical protein